MPYTVQCRSYSKKTVNQLYNYSTVLGATIKYKLYSEITVEIGTNLKTVKITLNIFAVCNEKHQSNQIVVSSYLLVYKCTYLKPKISENP